MTRAEYRYIGRTKDGGRLFVSVEIRHHGPEHTTDGNPIVKTTRDHREITEYDELAISGAWVPKHCRDAQSFGQNVDDLANLDMQTATIPADMVRDLLRLWQTRHLNGMNAGCIHQDDNVPVPHGADWRSIYAEQTAKCPEGYAYGSRWLVEVLSDEDIARAREIIAALNDQPQYQGD